MNTINNLKSSSKDIKNDEWYTPKSVLDKLLNQFQIIKFDYDPATTKKLAEKANILCYDDIDSNGLKQDWRSYHNIWINPPFSNKKEFIEKAYLDFEASVSQIENIFILVPIEALTNLNTYNLLSQNNNLVKTNIIIPKGRVKFVKFVDGEYTQKTSPWFSSVIIHLSRKQDYKLLWLDLN